MNKPFISKEQLIKQLSDTNEGKCSALQLQDWMVTFYDPPEVEIGPGETQSIQEAMNIVMNEYELADIAKFKAVGYQLAITFVNCNEDNFYARRQRFIRDSFND